jgi:hypothetical protein
LSRFDIAVDVRMSETSEKRDTLRLDHDEDADRKILIHPADNDLFVSTGRQVIAACQLGISLSVWVNELGQMLEEVQRWAEARKDKIVSCYSVPQGSRVLLFFVPRSTSFDFDLADELVSLNGDLVRKYNIGLVEMHEVPAAEYDRFFNIDTARWVYGERLGASPTVEA